MTFPSPDNIESKVRRIAVDGYYDKGKSRQNQAEAQAVVDEIARRLRSEELRKKSIGVVTFSVVQQALIEDLLSDLFIFHPELETFALECEEPLFIKNLENVQGDERDVILFSVGYGPDAEGRVSMNFGPLNRAGGERRLNVAVSRARYEMIIFSTLRSDMIDLNRTSSIGVAGLKRFLEYAEKGMKHPLNTSSNIYLPDEETSIEKIIADKLRSLGYTVHTDIGCSGYKIDIGIVDPQNPSSYRLGIICDGKNYKRTKTARDREIVQNNVLKALGWDICRIWTMDWWEKPDEVIATLRRRISQHADSNQENEEETVRTEEQKDTAKPEILKAAYPAISKKQLAFSLAAAIKEDRYKKRKVVYQETALTAGQYQATDFFFERSIPILLSQIKRIMENEAPISQSLICQKINAAWGISRMSQTGSHLDALIRRLNFYRSRHNGIDFLWLDEAQYRTYSQFRTDSNRAATDLPPEEIANAVKYVLTDSVSLPLPDLAKACAKLFGFPRMGSNIEASMQRGIQEAVKRKYAKVESGRITITG